MLQTCKKNWNYSTAHCGKTRHLVFCVRIQVIFALSQNYETRTYYPFLNNENKFHYQRKPLKTQSVDYSSLFIRLERRIVYTVYVKLADYR